MKKVMKRLLPILAAVLLLTACGDTDTDSKKDNNDEDDTVPDINYEDYIDPVVDRKVADCITAQELSAIMGVEGMTPAVVSDSVITYQSENGHYMVTLALENRTRAEFDTMVSDTTVWTAQAGLGEAAYWSATQTELVAYVNGYAVSVSGYHVIPGCLQTIMERVLTSLQ